MVKLGGWDFGFDAWESPTIHGVKYKKLKTFKGKDGKEQADDYVQDLLDRHVASHRNPPVIQKISIGLKLGYIYRVCIPE